MDLTLRYVVRFPRRLERSRRFYEDTLGLPLSHEDDGYAAFDVGGPVILALLARDRLSALLGEERGAPEGDERYEGEVAFLTGDVDAAHAELRERGVSFLAAPEDRPWGERTAYFEDPDGFLVEIAETL